MTIGGNIGQISASADPQAIVRLIGLLHLDPSASIDEVCWLDEDEDTAHWRLVGGIEVTCRFPAPGQSHWHVGTW